MMIIDYMKSMVLAIRKNHYKFMEERYPLKTVRKKFCMMCDEPMTFQRSTRKFCTNRCRMAYNRIYRTDVYGPRYKEDSDG